MEQKIQKLLNKYQTRYEECDAQWTKDMEEYKTLDSSEKNDYTRKRISYLNEDMLCLNSQIAAYECIVKDLKELLK